MNSQFEEDSDTDIKQMNAENSMNASFVSDTSITSIKK